MSSRLSQLLAPLLFLALVLAVWEGFVRLRDVPAYLLPPPSKIAAVLSSEAEVLARHAGITMAEALGGYLLANGVGFSLAVIFAHSSLVESAILPYAIALKTTPIVAMAPLLVLWLGTGAASKVVTSALICFFPVLVSATKGLRSVDPDAMALFRSLGATRWQIFVKLRLPQSLPFVFAGLKISTSLAVVGAIVGEFVGASGGLGYLILTASYRLETALMFAAVLTAAAGGLTLYAVVSLAERLLVFWQRPLE